MFNNRNFLFLEFIFDLLIYRDTLKKSDDYIPFIKNFIFSFRKKSADFYKFLALTLDSFIDFLINYFMCLTKYCLNHTW